MNHTSACLLNTIFFCTGQGKKSYTVSSITALLKNLKKHHEIKIGRRYLFKCLRYLIDAGYLWKQIRYNKKTNPPIKQIPSLYGFTDTGADFIAKRNPEGAKTLRATIKEQKDKNDRRPPGKKREPAWQPADPEYADYLRRV